MERLTETATETGCRTPAHLRARGGEAVYATYRGTLGFGMPKSWLNGHEVVFLCPDILACCRRMQTIKPRE
jgi:hypothetical protein